MEEKNILIVGFVLIVIGALGIFYGTPRDTSYGGGLGPGMMSSYQTTSPRYTSNGEMVYHTGVNEDAYRIIPNGGPNWLYMHGGSCVDCHGKDGRGGIVPMMCAEESPAITYHALTEEEHEEHGEEEHPPYTEETIKIAITQGIEPNNETVDWCMPRWQMSEKDLDDLVDYLKTLE